MHWLSIILGLIFAWAILSFIGPRKTVSYYVQTPVRVDNLAGLDGLMEAVGLQPSMPCAMTNTNEVPMEAAPAPAPAPISVADQMNKMNIDHIMTMKSPDYGASPSESVAEAVMRMDAQIQSSARGGPDTQTTPQPAAPGMTPAPLVQ